MCALNYRYGDIIGTHFSEGKIQEKISKMFINIGMVK